MVVSTPRAAGYTVSALYDRDPAKVGQAVLGDTIRSQDQLPGSGLAVIGHAPGRRRPRGRGHLPGIGVTTIPGTRIGRWAQVGAGGVDVRNLPDGIKARGVPARPAQERPLARRRRLSPRSR